MQVLLGVVLHVAVLLDLSQKHYLEAQKLGEAVQAVVEQKPPDLQIDVSNSVVGSQRGWQGILTALQSLPNATQAEAPGPMRISFVSRHNRITPQAVDSLFQILLERESVVVSHLDVGWNPLHPEANGYKTFLKSLQKMVQSPKVCPETLQFEHCGFCPAACRAIGKGILHRFRGGEPVTPFSLLLCGNRDIGDAGAAAIAAALRTVWTEATADKPPILNVLDLADCGISDAGAKALALALESAPPMGIRKLDLSNNRVSNVGAAAIGHALLLSAGGAEPTEKTGRFLLEGLDLSGNVEIGDEAAAIVAQATAGGLIGVVRLRSCRILADGAAAFGTAVASLAHSGAPPPLEAVEIDLSGNPLGVLRGNRKKDAKYSASAIKSKATATTAAYMSILQRGIKGALKEYGLGGANSGESDDEEEARSGMAGELLGDGELDPSKARCGIKAFSNAILEETANPDLSERFPKCKVLVGFRCCFLDHGAADALAAVLVHAKEDLKIDLAFDVAMNPVLEPQTIDAVQGSEEQSVLAREMAERYLDALQALRESRQRGADAARAAAARMRAEKELESEWDPPSGLEDDWIEEDNDDWDSDVDYEEEGDEAY